MALSFHTARHDPSISAAERRAGRLHRREERQKHRELKRALMAFVKGR